MAEGAERVGRVRKGRREGGFTVVRNELINHRTLAVEARALMIYLLSRPDDWELQIADVRRFLGRGDKPCGRDKAYSVVKELKQAGYLVMCEDVNGQHFAGVTYYVFDEPVSDPEEVQRRHKAGEDATITEPKSSLPENPEAGVSPLPDFPYPENQHETNKRYIQNTDPPLPPKPRQRRRTRAREGECVAPAADHLAKVAEPWSPEWVEHRIRLLRRGRKQRPAKPSRFVAQLIAKGGEAGERERLAHQARTCWPTVLAMDEATHEARGWRVPSDLFDLDLVTSYRSVRIDSDEFVEWQEAHRLRGWPPFPVPSRAPCVLLPTDGVSALDVPNEEPARAVNR
ncbi:hypothetical protein ACFFP0_00760 [Rhizobium puerariae]|uniref:Helix-turn-helix domain-containing protein n=1 Tax=Rhizobium puerariae TaxID=1585791 RepID=A0ABV6A9Z5_9HYPH